ncbi:hypothetical protein Q8F55_003585 [Vanrija albida]|uniref:alpha-1,2-Mannosidase n=1 Tax=Vanrija albida TaxID=181172 RepID=A0ABR3Q4W5_9TREE
MRSWTALLVACAAVAHALSDAERASYRDRTRAAFKHGFDSYMAYGYPHDEVRPLSCTPMSRFTADKNDIGIMDIAANCSLTLIDTLPSLPDLYPEAFADAVERVATAVSFDQDVKVQLFEMTIRPLGALLSTYQILERLPSPPKLQAEFLGLNGEVDAKRHAKRILALARDLADRMMPAFDTITGLPWARINLRRGLAKTETIETCAAGAGSLTLEFGLLSRLTGEPRYEAAARRAFFAVWKRRVLGTDLLGNAIAVSHGQWLAPGFSGVGAGMDSFFEYALKTGIVFDDPKFIDVYYDANAAIQHFVRTHDGFIYRPIHLKMLSPSQPPWIDSLSAFHPALMVLGGDIESAIRSHLVFWNLWRKYSAIPESWDPESREPGWTGWPGRPEFIESTYYLFKATGDPFYLRVGVRVFEDIMRRTKAKCGFSSLQDVVTGARADRQETFLLSETLKYLYLLFDAAPSKQPLNSVFTTEGHPIHLPKELHNRTAAAGRSQRHRGEDLWCPLYHAPAYMGVRLGIEARADYDYARSLVFGFDAASADAEDSPVAKSLWDLGTCVEPVQPQFLVDTLIANDRHDNATEVPHGKELVWQATNGDWIINNTFGKGTRVGLRWRMDQRGYDVATIAGAYRVRPGQQVHVLDGKAKASESAAGARGHEPARVTAAITPLAPGSAPLRIPMSTATFGRPFAADLGLFGVDSPPARLVLNEANAAGCAEPDSKFKPPPQPFVMLVVTGNCSNAIKAYHAAKAGAAGMILGDDAPAARPLEDYFRPTAASEPDWAAGAIANITIGYVASPHYLNLAALLKTTPLSVAVEPFDPDTSRTDGAPYRRAFETETGTRLRFGDHDVVNIQVLGA